MLSTPCFDLCSQLEVVVDQETPLEGSGRYEANLIAPLPRQKNSVGGGGFIVQAPAHCNISRRWDVLNAASTWTSTSNPALQQGPQHSRLPFKRDLNTAAHALLETSEAPPTPWGGRPKPCTRNPRRTDPKHLTILRRTEPEWTTKTCQCESVAAARQCVGRRASRGVGRTDGVASPVILAAATGRKSGFMLALCN